MTRRAARLAGKFIATEDNEKGRQAKKELGDSLVPRVVLRRGVLGQAGLRQT